MPTIPEVRNKYHAGGVGADLEGTGVLIDRSTRWGNPFHLDVDGTRDEVCDSFEYYAQWRLLVQPTWLMFLRGKNLYCTCAPKRCHGDTLLKLANK